MRSIRTPAALPGRRTALLATCLVAALALTATACNSGDDKASALAFANGVAYPTTVTVFVCYNWSPPMAGVLFVPTSITMRAVITETMQRQEGE